MKRIKIVLLLLMLISLSCSQNEHPCKGEKEKPELLIYSGITMNRAVKELAGNFEKKENVKIYIISDSSGFLLKSILLNKKGDIFYPGKMSFVHELRDKHMILSSRYVGYNQITFLVQKGNPKNIKPNLDELMRSDISIGIGDADYSSIGRETKRVLETAGLFNYVINNVAYIAPNSKGLVEAIKNNEIDLAINWKATAYCKENIGKVEIINLPKNIAKPNYLLMCSLSCSKNIKLAEKFLDYAASYDAQEILIKYGLSD